MPVGTSGVGVDVGVGVGVGVVSDVSVGAGDVGAAPDRETVQIAVPMARRRTTMIATRMTERARFRR
jgi:hypothetical protein